MSVCEAVLNLSNLDPMRPSLLPKSSSISDSSYLYRYKAGNPASASISVHGVHIDIITGTTKPLPHIGIPGRTVRREGI